MDKYRFRIIDFVCIKCDVMPQEVKVGITSHKHLIVQWKCKKCHKDIQATLTQEELFADVPALKQLSAPEYTEEDVSFLTAMKISLSSP